MSRTDKRKNESYWTVLEFSDARKRFSKISFDLNSERKLLFAVDIDLIHVRYAIKPGFSLR